MSTRSVSVSPREASRPRHLRASRRSGAGGTLLGVFIGLVLGLGLAAGIAFYLMKGANPNPPATAAKEAVRDPAREAARTGKVEPGAAEKPRFDFYKILPGTEEAKIRPKSGDRIAPDKATVERAAAPERSTERPGSPEKSAERAAAPDRAVARADERPATVEKGARERFWLQAGSFASEPDAENLKARLALAGWEATIQQANVPDKGPRFRVRLGPYDNAEEMNRIKSELGKRGFDAAVIK